MTMITGDVREKMTFIAGRTFCRALERVFKMENESLFTMPIIIDNTDFTVFIYDLNKIEGAMGLGIEETVEKIKEASVMPIGYLDVGAPRFNITKGALPLPVDKEKRDKLKITTSFLKMKATKFMKDTVELSI